MKILLFFIIAISTSVRGFNYTEFFLERNPYLAREIIQEFTNFSGGINSALGLAEPHSHGHDIRGSSDGSVGLEAGKDNYSQNCKSSTGVLSMFAVLNENVWGRVSCPGFEGVMRPEFRSRDELPQLMGMLLRAAEEDYNTKIRNVIFTPSWIKVGIHMANLKAETKQAFFQYPDKTMEIVNDVIRRRFGNSKNFPDFLTQPLPDTTQAFIVNTKEQRGHWPSFTDYAGVSSFKSSLTGDSANSGLDSVNMFEIRGKFKFWEKDNFQFVTVPFKGTKLQVTLILPTESNQKLDWSALKSENGTQDMIQNVRIRLPVKTFLSRNKIEVSNSTDCDKQNSKSSPCFQLLDALTYTSFSPTEFQFITLTGGYIDSPYLAHFKVKSSSNNNNNNNWRSPNFPPLESWRWQLPPRKTQRSSHASLRSWPWILPFGRFSSYDFNNSNFAAERIIIFDRPFYWFVRGKF